MQTLEGYQILNVQNNPYLPESAKSAVGHLLLDDSPDALDIYDRVNGLLDEIPGYDFIPSQDKLAHIVKQMEAPDRGLYGTIADGLEGVTREMVTESEIKKLIIEGMRFDQIYFTEEGFLGITLGKYSLVLQIGEPSGTPGIFFLRDRYGNWTGYNPRETLVGKLTPDSFQGYISTPPGALGTKFCEYIDTKVS